MSTLRVDSIKRLGAASADSDSISIASDGNVTIKGLDEGHVLQTVHYEHYDAEAVTVNNYYTWGQTEYNCSITTRKNNSYINVRIRIFGEPAAHNAHGRVYMAVNDGSFASLPTVNGGQQGHLKLDYYEASGTDYNSTPKQHWYETIVNTATYTTGTKFSFKLLNFNGSTMRFNSAYNSGIIYETAPSTLTLQELNNANTTLNRAGSPANAAGY